MNGMKTNLNIYFSATCNLHCEYCAMGDSNPLENIEIRNAIKSNAFQTKVIEKCQELQPVTLGIWGMEPTINQDLWATFIIPILESCNSIKGIFLSTNGLIFKYTDWANCLENYCTQSQRKIKLWIQFSLDNPTKAQIGTNNILSCCYQYITNPYFRIKLSTKSTFQQADLYQDIDNWYSWAASLQDLCKTIAQPGCDVSLIGQAPTLERPGNWTKEDGIRWAQWGIKADTSKIITCSAGINSWTIDYLGNIYDCQMKLNRNGPDADVIPTYERYLSYVEDCIAHDLIPAQDPAKLYRGISTQYCWALGQKEAPERLYSYIQAWGNGALQEDIE